MNTASQDSAELFQIKCSDGTLTWLAYDGIKFSKEWADSEADGCRKQWPNCTFEVIPAGN
jgi:hypothetical protein